MLQYAEEVWRSFWNNYGDVCRALLDIGVVEDHGPYLVISRSRSLVYASGDTGVLSRSPTEMAARQVPESHGGTSCVIGLPLAVWLLK
jgi:hypothetical protein